MAATLYKLDLDRPHTVYRLANGDRAVGTTTVTDAMDKAWMQRWSAGLEREGILQLVNREWMEIKRHGSWPEGYDLDEAVAAFLPSHPSGKPYYFSEQKRDKAADLGTLVHERVRAWHKGGDVDPEGLDPTLYLQSHAAFDRYRRWWDEGELESIAVELPLVSESRKVGGTLDHVTRSRRTGERILNDLKTSKPHPDFPFDNMIAQVGGSYAPLWDEVHPAEPIDRVVIHRLGKDPGDLGGEHWLTAEQRRYGVDLFVSALGVYRARQALKKLR